MKPYTAKPGVFRLGGLALLLVGAALPCRAQLLTPTYETKLEGWLGAGNLTCTNIFTKNIGDGQDSLDFHAAADFKGPTFVLYKVGSYMGNESYYGLPQQVIGGYNPQSWTAGGGFHVTPNDADRTAFLFNLTYDSIRRQRLADSYGNYQTYVSTGYGPTFGGGHDIWSNGTLEWGYSNLYSYGSGPYGGELTSGGYGSINGNQFDLFSILQLEVYTFEAAPDGTPSGGGAVPEPSTYGLLGAATLLGLATYRRRMRR